ncbi:type VII secretion target [Rhodococcus sp. 077-4]|uniref:type VII secretion target n=1 Tax=Rhodococcus sp. 077-4 TaxID=2789271 RepID=UPI0039F50FBE
MAELVVETEGVLAYGAVASTMAEQIAAAGAAAAACGPAVLAPIFGLIGQEFLGAVTGTHAAHTDAVLRLSGAVASIGSAATASAVSYALTDAGTGVAVAAAGTTAASAAGIAQDAR